MYAARVGSSENDSAHEGSTMSEGATEGPVESDGRDRSCPCRDSGGFLKVGIGAWSFVGRRGRRRSSSLPPWPR